MHQHLVKFISIVMPVVTGMSCFCIYFQRMEDELVGLQGYIHIHTILCTIEIMCQMKTTLDFSFNSN